MSVPKMVENGFNSVSSVRITYRSIDSTWNQKQRAKAKRGINTIFDLFGTAAVARPRKFKKPKLKLVPIMYPIFSKTYSLLTLVKFKNL